MYFNPGLPEARKHVVGVIMEVVNRYKIDGVHFDDYFYPYKIKDEDFPDSLTFLKLNGTFENRDEWRRHNVDLLIKEVHDSIKAVKPFVQFGVSPFGVWRNQRTDANGSATKAGQTCYDDLYANILKWQKEKWVDYVIPQIYWSIGFEAADYQIIAKWWNENSYGIPIYTGNAAYRIGNSTDNRWKEPDQLPKQIRLNRSLSNLHGSAFFSSNSFRSNPMGFSDSLKNNLFRFLALPPEIKIEGIKDSRQYPIQFIGGRQGITLIWEEKESFDELSTHHRYIIYRFNKRDKVDISDISKIVAILPETNELHHQTFTDRKVRFGKIYHYVVTSMDVYNRESKPESTFSISNKSGSWRVHTGVLIK